MDIIIHSALAVLLVPVLVLLFGIPIGFITDSYVLRYIVPFIATAVLLYKTESRFHKGDKRAKKHTVITLAIGLVILTIIPFYRYPFAVIACWGEPLVASEWGSSYEKAGNFGNNVYLSSSGFFCDEEAAQERGYQKSPYY